MSITYTIPGATTIDQLSEATADGQIDENARENCVVASLAEGLHILTGGAFDGDQLKDAVYGQGYTGTMSAAHFFKYCADRGVALTVHNDSQAGLVETIHAEVSANHPVLVTMPSQWGTAPADPMHPDGYTHVGIAVGVGPGMIRCMNPWHGFFQDQSDDWWAARLCYGQVWVMSAAAQPPTGTAGGSNMALVRNADGSATDSSNGLKVGSGIAGFIFDHNLQSADLLTGEVYFTNGGQHQAACALSNGAIVRWYGSGGDQNAAAVMTGLMGEIANAQKSASDAQATAKSASDANAALTANKADLLNQITSLQKQLAEAQAQPAPVPSVPAPSIPLPADALETLVRAIYDQARADYLASRVPHSH